LLTRRPPISTLFPYTTLFRSVCHDFFGARDVKLAARQHEVRLRVHFPQNESHLNRAKSRPVWFRLASTRLPPSSCDARGLGHGLPHLIVQLLELFAVANGKRWLRRAKRQDRLRQAGAISQEALACSLDSGQRIFFRSLEPPAAAHHEDQQRRAPLERLSIKANDIPRKLDRKSVV